MKFTDYIQACPVIAILRGVTPDEICGVCDALFEGGVTSLEIPLNSPDPFESISRAAKHCGERQQVGAGTVLTAEDVRRVHQAGGTFIISPNVDASVIRETKLEGLVSIPGFLTPTEGFAAIQAGADFLKLFPAGHMGVSYVKDLKAVIKKPILAVGGINLSNVGEFMSQCAGAGIGTSLYKPGKSLDAIRSDAQLMVNAARR